MKKSIVIGLVQHAADRDREICFDRSCSGIAAAAAQGAECIVLQELHGGVYFCQSMEEPFFDWAESIPGPSTERFAKLAKQHQVVLVLSLFERRMAGVYHNTAVVIEKDGSIAGIYRKMHIPDDPGFCEKYYFTPGDLGFNPIKTSVGNLGVMVCWDQWFPEAARAMALAGADVLIYPTAIGWIPVDDLATQQKQRDAWITIQRSHAIANALPVVVCNRTGIEAHPHYSEQHIQFWGSSFIAGVQGEILAEAAVDTDQVLVQKLDLSRTEKIRRLWPFLRDRRVEYYDNEY